MNYKDLPIIAEVKIPLRAKHIEDSENKDNNFHCGFANFKLQDSIANVSDDNDVEVGSLGGAFGGFYEVNKYYPNQEDYKQWFNVQLNTDDIWYAVEKVLDGLQTDPEQMAELRKKMDAYVEKKEKAAEIKRMAKEAAEEAELERFIAEEEAEIKRLEDELGGEDE
jgi:uncharacterized membrane protein YqiK